MPVYEYECTECGFVQEEEHSMKSIPEKTVCKECGKESKKIFSKVSGIVDEGDKFFTSEGKY
ncbi:MAG: FmdB family zinc ribbon protein [Atribacterota bacterium]